MKKQWAITAIILVLVAAFISNCNNTHNPAIALIVPITPTPCAAGNVSYSNLSYGTTLPLGYYIITSQAFYLANYSEWAPAGTPTPTPVPVDFSKQMVIGVITNPGCGCCGEASNSLTNITTDCSKVSVVIQSTNSYCGGPMCEMYIGSGISWYVMNKTSLPFVGQFMYTDSCTGATTTATAPFVAAPNSTPVINVYIPLPPATPTPIPW